jgi:UDP-galactopyranose mutase
MMKVLVVGAGFSGGVIARELAERGDVEVDVIDRRDHIGGNTYDPLHPRTGQRYHRYGPHIFHTNSDRIVDYLSRFTNWLPYRHRVQALLPNGQAAPMPINIDTLNLHYGLALAGEADMRAFLERVRVPIAAPANAEEHLQSIYGRELTELYFGRYTRKMWALELAELPISVVARLPVRYDHTADYFDDAHQLMPADGYLALFERLLDHPRIRVTLGVAFEKTMERGYDHVFNGMPIDDYFEQAFGPLPYRSIRFEHRLDEAVDQAVPTLNFTDEGPCTRRTDWSLYPGCDGRRGALMTYETPCSYEDNGFERYYPVKTVDGWPQARYRQYAERAKGLDHVTFIGRCGQYIYYDMHQVVANSLMLAEQFLAART